MEMVKKLKGFILDVLLLGIMVVLAGDLLYLYFAGAWYDPSAIIEISELATLYLVIILGVGRVAFKIRSLGRLLDYEELIKAGRKG